MVNIGRRWHVLEATSSWSHLLFILRHQTLPQAECKRRALSLAQRRVHGSLFDQRSVLFDGPVSHCARLRGSSARVIEKKNKAGNLRRKIQEWIGQLTIKLLLAGHYGDKIVPEAEVVNIVHHVETCTSFPELFLSCRSLSICRADEDLIAMLGPGYVFFFRFLGV